MRSKVLLLVLFLLASAHAASAQLIGIFGDLNSSYCSIYVAPSTSGTLYVNVLGAGALNPPGLAGAEFRVVHNIGAGDAIFTATPSPMSTVVIGDPLQGGCNIAFATCQTGFSINLYVLNVFVLNGATMDNQVLMIDAHSTPSNPNFPCPLINQCDSPVYTAVCVLGGHGCINDLVGFCIIDAVEARSWSEVKALYD